MELLAHRGWWHPAGPQNDLTSLLHALEEGHGLETDIRDRSGTLVVSHDPPNGSACALETLIGKISENESGGTIALNVKSDGLASACAALVAPILDRCFFFDMSVPDMRGYLREKLPVFTRHSDVETIPVYYAESNGVWVDELDQRWVTAKVVEDHLNDGKKVAVVSSELHGRDPKSLWNLLRPYAGVEELLLCTDLVDDARRFFAPTDGGRVSARARGK